MTSLQPLDQFSSSHLDHPETLKGSGFEGGRRTCSRQDVAVGPA